LRLGEANGSTSSALLSHNRSSTSSSSPLGTTSRRRRRAPRRARVRDQAVLAEQIRQLVTQISRGRALEVQVDDLKSQLDVLDAADRSRDQAQGMREVLDVLGKAPATTCRSCLRGENGTGKTILARHLHALSARASRPFVVVNCPTLSEELLASELSASAGAFTGAVRGSARPRRVGPLAARSSSTRSASSPLPCRPSCCASCRTPVRARRARPRTLHRRRAHHRRHQIADVECRVKAGRFRETSLFRLNTIELVVPACASAADDIVNLARRFARLLRAHPAARRVPRLSFDREAEAALNRLRLAGQRGATAQRHGARLDPPAGGLTSARAAPAPRRRLGEPSISPLTSRSRLIEREHTPPRHGARATAEEAVRACLGIDSSTPVAKTKTIRRRS